MIWTVNLLHEQSGIPRADSRTAAFNMGCQIIFALVSRNYRKTYILNVESEMVACPFLCATAHISVNKRLFQIDAGSE